MHILANLVRVSIEENECVWVAPAGRLCRVPAGTVAEAPACTPAEAHSCSQCTEPGREQVSVATRIRMQTTSVKHLFHLDQFLLLYVATGVVVVLLAGARNLNPLLASVSILFPSRLAVSLLLKKKLASWQKQDKESGVFFCCRKLLVAIYIMLPDCCTLSLCKVGTPVGTVGCKPVSITDQIHSHRLSCILDLTCLLTV